MRFIVLILLLAGCQKYGVTVKEESLGRSSLASTYAGSPDPRQKNPPQGSRLIIYWKGPPEWLETKHRLMVDVIGRNYKKTTYTYTLHKRRGRVVIGEKEGALTYRARIENEKGEEIAIYRQQLWFELIDEG